MIIKGSWVVNFAMFTLIQSPISFDFVIFARKEVNKSVFFFLLFFSCVTLFSLFSPES